MKARTIAQILLIVFNFSVASYATEQGFISEIRPLFKSSDIVFYGEFHGVANERKNILSLLEDLLKTDSIDAFATEYVGSELHSELSIFLLSKERRSRAKERFFNALDKNYMWPAFPENREFYRKLYRLKRRYPNLKICPIDSDYFDDEKRERQIALNILGCSSNSQKTLKTLVHIGAAHAFSTRFELNHFRTASQRLRKLSPSLQIKTIGSALTYKRKADEWRTIDEANFLNSLDTVNQKLNLANYKLFSSDTSSTGQLPELPFPSIGEQIINFKNAFDYLILGPYQKQSVPK